DAAATRREVESWRVPARELLDELRNAETELRIADAKLHVGLTMTVTTQASVELEVEIDGEDRPFTAQAMVPLEFEAKSRVSVQMPGLGEVAVRGGTRDLINAASAARERWKATVAHVLANTACETLAEAEALSERARIQLEEVQKTD